MGNPFARWSPAPIASLSFYLLTVKRPVQERWVLPRELFTRLAGGGGRATYWKLLEMTLQSVSSLRRLAPCFCKTPDVAAYRPTPRKIAGLNLPYCAGTFLVWA